MDANSYGEVRDGEQSDMMLVRELQIRLVELLSVSSNEVGKPEVDAPETYDELLLQIRAEPEEPLPQTLGKSMLPSRKRQRFRDK